MPSVNKVTLMGHLGKDAETRFTPQGVSVTQFSVATTHSWKPQGATEWKEDTTWHNVVAWRLSEKLQPLLIKGNLVYVEGRLQTRSYEKDGATKYITEVVADRVHFLREPFRGGPRDEEAPPAAHGPAIDDDDLPY